MAILNAPTKLNTRKTAKEWKRNSKEDMNETFGKMNESHGFFWYAYV